MEAIGSISQGPGSSPLLPVPIAVVLLLVVAVLAWWALPRATQQTADAVAATSDGASAPRAALADDRRGVGAVEPPTLPSRARAADVIEIVWRLRNGSERSVQVGIVISRGLLGHVEVVGCRPACRLIAETTDRHLLGFSRPLWPG